MGEVQLQPGVSSQPPPPYTASPLFPFWFLQPLPKLTLTFSGKVGSAT